MKKILLATLIGAGTLLSAATTPIQIKRYSNTPADAFGLAARSAGTVELELTVDAQGNLKATRVVKGRPDLVQAAVRTVRNWDFQPASVDGKGVTAKMNVVLGFQFDGR